MSISTLEIGDLWMEIRDLKMLKSLMIVQEVSNRKLARAAGWKSHSYMNRIISGAAHTLEPEPALRIAKFLGVDVGYLFVTKVSTDSTQTEQKKKVA